LELQRIVAAWPWGGLALSGPSPSLYFHANFREAPWRHVPRDAARASSPKEGALAKATKASTKKRASTKKASTKRTAASTGRKKPAARAAKKPTKKVAKKAVRKPAKKAVAKKAARKPAKKTAAKKPARKPAKKTAAKNPARKPAKKTAAQKPARKPAKKAAAKKPARKPAKAAAAKKPARKPAKKVAAKKPARKKTVTQPAAWNAVSTKPTSAKSSAQPLVVAAPQKQAPKKFQRQYKTWLRRLIGLRRRLLGETTQLEEEALKAGENDVSIDHMADYGSDSYEQEFTLSLIESKSEALRDVDEAIRKIEVGTYGLCEECETLIPKARLEVLPHTRLCIECKSAQESASGF
jgi:RNA polymerase-binding transcription factor DksA